MTTGDIKNNLRKLQAELKAVNYTADADYDRLSKGIPEVFLGIYHYVFVNYSRAFAEKVSELNVELYGKTDMRFMEAMYKVLRELFAYKPPLTKEQFFSPGYAEMKVIMCSDILGLVKKFHKDSLPKKPKSVKGKSNMSTAVSSAVGIPFVSKLGPRPSSAAPGKSTKGTKDSSMKSTDSSIVSVVSDITCPASPPTRIRANKDKDKTVAGINKTYDTYPVDRITMPADLSVIEPVPVKALVKKHGSPVKKERFLPPDVSVDVDDIPIDVIASTPCRPVEDIRVKTTEKPEFVGQLNYLLKQMQDLTSKLVSMESRMGTVENQLSMLGDAVTSQQSGSHPGNHGMLDPTQVENLLARITLAENKIAIMEAQNAQGKAPVVVPSCPNYTKEPQHNITVETNDVTMEHPATEHAREAHAGTENARRERVNLDVLEHTGAERTGLEHTGAEHTGAEHTGAEHTGLEHTGADTTESEEGKTKTTSSPIAVGFKSIHMHEGCSVSPSPIASFRRRAAEADHTAPSLYLTTDASSLDELNVGRMDLDSLSTSQANSSKILNQKQRIASLVLETEKLLNVEGKVDPIF